MKEKGKTTLVRIGGVDVEGSLKLREALRKIKGIGWNLATVLTRKFSRMFNFPPDITIGEIPEETREKMDELLKNLEKLDIPRWLLNQRKEFYTGENKHFIMNDLIFYQKMAIEREKEMWSWKGYRHAYGQKVRGQRTKNTGRRGMTVGVTRGQQRGGK